MDADFVLTVGDGQVSESVPLGREIEDEDWYVLGDFTPDEQAAAFDDEAAETVADQVVELLRKLDASWPICAEHRRLMSSCSGVWICDGPPPHDVAKVGRLGA